MVVVAVVDTFDGIFFVAPHFVPISIVDELFVFLIVVVVVSLLFVGLVWLVRVFELTTIELLNGLVVLLLLTYFYLLISNFEKIGLVWNRYD